MRGMGMNVVPVPLHFVILDCGLVQGKVAMGVRPALPNESIHVILGNGLLEEGPPPPIVSPVSLPGR